MHDFEIEVLRKQCRVEHALDDDELVRKSKSAQVIFSRMIDRPIYETQEEVDADKTGVKWDEAIEEAVLTILADIYENRGSNLDYQTYENKLLAYYIGLYKRLYVGFL